MWKKEEIKYLIVITIIFIAACIETDIYLPAFPDMMKAFAVSEGTIQGLLTWNFVGICLSGPFYGPISDSLGRKKPLMIALLLFLLGSVLTLFALNFPQMIAGRILQGLGSGGCFTLGTAIIFDAFQKEKAVCALNNLNMAIPIIMSLAPMVGGFLNYTYGFRSNFLLIALFVLVSLFLCLFFFKESLLPEKRLVFKFSSVAKDFKRVITHSAFQKITLATSFLFAGYIGFLSYTSLLFVSEFGISKNFSPFFQVLILCTWTIGGLCLKRVLAALGNKRVKKTGLILCIIGTIAFMLTTFLYPQNPYLLVGSFLPYIFGANWVFGLYFPEAMELLPDIKGITASLITSARLLIAALTVGLISSLYNATIYPLMLVILATLLIILPCLISYEKKALVISE
ncbi:MAG: MFS transporter [Verrucomicrobia bacterium]|nr:MFS transporter [Verrucomicrobiota bacterium]